MTVADVVSFIIKHRRGKAFYKYSVPDIVGVVMQGIEDNTLGIVKNPAGEIEGICIAHKNDRMKYLHIMHILTIRKGLVRKLLELKRSLYPDYTISGNRHGRLKEFKPELIAAFERI